MTVAFDASILIYVIDEQAKPPADPATGKPVDRCHERVTHLLETLQQENTKIVIPTPALAEALVRALKNPLILIIPNEINELMSYCAQDVPY